MWVDVVDPMHELILGSASFPLTWLFDIGDWAESNFVLLTCDEKCSWVIEEAFKLA